MIPFREGLFVAAGPVWGGGDRGSGLSLKNHKNIGVQSNTGPDPLKNHKAFKPAFNVGSTSARSKAPFIWVQSNTGPDPLKKHKAIKPAFNVGSTSARQQSAIYMVSKQYWSGSHERSQSYKSSIQCMANIGTPAKRHLNGFLLMIARL